MFEYQTKIEEWIELFKPTGYQHLNLELSVYLTPHYPSRLENLSPGTSVSIDVSYFEIYNEKIHDLLAIGGTRTPLKVREHPEWGPYIVDLSVHSVKTYEELREWLLLGNNNRATAATAMNEKSSRSHSIFSIELCVSEGLNETDSSRRSKVSLVDLAGSERLGSSHNTEEKIRQGVSINKSLLTLGKVISALAEQKRNSFVPYRESILTWLLRVSIRTHSYIKIYLFTCMESISNCLFCFRIIHFHLIFKLFIFFFFITDT